MMMAVTGDIQVESLTPRHLERVFNHYTWSPSTRNVRVGILKMFFGWCRSRRFMTRDNDPLLGWRSERVPDQERTRIPVQEWPALFDAVRRPQEQVVLACGLFLFLRSSETMNLRLKDVDLQNGLVDVWRPKTKQRDTMPISTELDGHLRQHLTWMASMGWTDPDHFLAPAFTKDFQRDDQNRWIPGTGLMDPTRPVTHPHRLVQAVMRRAGYELRRGEGGHTLRRSGARAYFDSLVADGYDGALRRVQAMLGHQNAFMTEIYLGLDLDRATRNADLSGKPMFPGITSGVTAMRKVSDAM
jgi:integrase